MPENGESLFDSIDFGEDLLLTGDEIEISTNTETEEEKAAKEKAAKNDEQLIDTDELSSNNQESDDNIQAGKTATSSSPLSSIVTALGEELGIEINTEDFSKLKTEDEKAQFLRDMIEGEINKRAASNLSEEEKEALEAIRTGVSPKELVNTKVNQKTYASITEDDIKENDKLQEALVINSLITRGFAEDKAKKMVADFKALGESKLYEEAMEAKTFMVEKEKEHEAKLKEQAKQDLKSREEQRTQSLERVKNFVMSQKEVIPGLDLTESFKEDLYKSMTTAVAKDPQGNPLNSVQVTRSKNPIDFEFKLNLYHKLGLFEEKPDFSKIMKVAETKTAQGLKALLKEGNDFIDGGKPKKTKDTDDLGLSIFS